MQTNGDRPWKSADQRYREFAQKNKAWNQRVKNTISGLDKVASKAKRGSTRRASS